MLCLKPLCGVIVGPMALTAGVASFLGTLAALGLAACAAAEPRQPRETEGRATAAGEPEAPPRRRRRGQAL